MPINAPPENPPPSGRRLVRIALVYGAGIWCAAWFDRWDWRWVLAASAAMLAVCLAAQWLRPVWLARAGLWAGWFLAAWGLTGARWDAAGPEQLGRLLQRARESVELQGRIAGQPVFYHAKARSAGAAELRGLWLFDFDISHIRRLPDWQPARGRVRVFLAGAESLQPQSGSAWRLAGALTDHLSLHSERRQWQWYWPASLGQPSAPAPAGCPPRASAALKTMRRYTLRADPRSARLAAAASAWQPGPYFQAWRRRAGELLALGLAGRPDVAAILRALILGYDEELPSDLRRRFVATGTFHLFAISGTHMALLALLAAGVLRLAGISRIYWFLGVAPVLAFFTAMVGAPASAVRGSLMAGLWLLGMLVGRRGDGVSALALAGWLILLCAPAQLFAPGFILSFVTVAGLMCIAPFCTRLRADAAPAPIDPARKRWRVWMRQVWRACLFSTAASTAAWLAAMPLMACWFNVWSPLSALANVPVIPLAGISLGLGFLAMLLGGLHPGLAAACNWMNIAPVILMRDWLAFVQSIPGCQLLVSSPPVWAICAWYAGWGILVWRRIKLTVARRAARAAAADSSSSSKLPADPAYGALADKPRRQWDWRLPAALALIAVWPAWDFTDGCAGRVQIMNAGGRAVVLGCGPGLVRRAFWLVNAGNLRQARQLRQMLAQAGVNRLDLWMLSGMDAGNVNAAADLIESGEFKPARTVYPAGAPRYRVFAGLLRCLAQAGAHLTEATQAVSGELAGNLVWQARPGADAPGRMTAETAWAAWAAAITPGDAEGQLPPRIAIAPRHAAGPGGAGGRMIIECAPHGFGPQFMADDAESRVALAPGQMLTLDFTRQGVWARWMGSAAGR